MHKPGTIENQHHKGMMNIAETHTPKPAPEPRSKHEPTPQKPVKKGMSGSTFMGWILALLVVGAVLGGG
ncbi:MAG: hypothetical protein ABJL67_12655 [Sulfitobacter sp.]